MSKRNPEAEGVNKSRSGQGQVPAQGQSSAHARYTRHLLFASERPGVTDLKYALFLPQRPVRLAITIRSFPASTKAIVFTVDTIVRGDILIVLKHSSPLSGYCFYAT
jgi:hypothetical protein